MKIEQKVDKLLSGRSFSPKKRSRKLLMGIGTSVLFIGAVFGVAQVFQSYVTQEVTVDTEPVFYYEGIPVEDYTESVNLSINAGESDNITRTLQYTGNLPVWNISFVVVGNASEGLNVSTLLDGIEVTDGIISLTDNNQHNVTIIYELSKFAKAGSHYFEVILTPVED